MTKHFDKLKELECWYCHSKDPKFYSINTYIAICKNCNSDKTDKEINLEMNEETKKKIEIINLSKCFVCKAKNAQWQPKYPNKIMCWDCYFIMLTKKDLIPHDMYQWFNDIEHLGNEPDNEEVIKVINRIVKTHQER